MNWLGERAVANGPIGQVERPAKSSPRFEKAVRLQSGHLSDEWNNGLP
jgi:hypothetical protein